MAMPTAPARDSTTETLPKLFEQIMSAQQTLGVSIYRGQADSNWPIVSGAYRRFQITKRSRGGPQPVTTRMMLQYLSDLVHEAGNRLSMGKSVVDSSSYEDMRVLSEVQHYGGATNLIDFTKNPLIALYFACAEEPLKDGAIHCANANDDYKYKWLQGYGAPISLSLSALLPAPEGLLYVYSPAHLNLRIVKQHSVFVFNESGLVPTEHIDHKIIVRASLKQEALQFLHRVCGLTEEAIYPDFAGYIQTNGWRTAIPLKTEADYLRLAKVYESKGLYRQSIDYLQRAAEESSSKLPLYRKLSRQYRYLGEFDKALETMLSARALGEWDSYSANTLAVAYAYVGQWEKAISEIDQALALATTDDERRLAHTNKAWILLSTHRSKQARQLLEADLITDRSFHTLINLAHCNLMEESLSGARGLYMETARLVPGTDGETAIRWAMNSDYASLKLDTFIGRPEYDHLIEEMVAEYNSRLSLGSAI